jgi:hypothetical protein
MDELVSLGLASVISLTNFIIKKFLMWFTKYEGHETYSNYYSSVTQKISYIQTMNSCFNIFITHWIIYGHTLKTHIFKPEGSMSQDYMYSL